MSRKIKLQLIACTSIVFMILGFQNCSKVGFSSGGDQEANASGNFNPTDDDNPNYGGDLSVDDVQEDRSLIEIEGSCVQANGDVALDGDVIQNDVHSSCQNNKYKMCARLLNTGANDLSLIQAALTQESGKTEIDYSAFTTTVTVKDRVFNFMSVEVMTTTQAQIKVRCFPGAAISAEIYGQSQFKNPLVCPSSGQLTFNAALIAKLRNTGQRVVTVRQLMENGFITEIFADVDNVVSGHSCSLDSGVANSSICADSAGTVSGTCKPGLPVKILVNGLAQHSVVCDSSGRYSMENILLDKNISENLVTLEQYNSFSNSSCTSSKRVSSITDL